MLGTKGKQELIVSPELTAKKVGSGVLDVFATPMMVAFVEETCWKSVADQLEEGQTTVGSLVNIQHLAPSPVGMKMTCESELVEVDRKRLVFQVTVYDEVEEVGKGTHERFIINTDKFLVKAGEKAAKVK